MVDCEMIIIEGVDKGLHYPINKSKITIGRNKDNDIVLRGDLVSRYHSELCKIGEDAVIIKDLGSTNRTIFNGKAISEQKLKIGDQVQIGNTVFLFTTVREAEEILKEVKGKVKSKEKKRVITITEMKLVPDVNKLLDASFIGDDIEALRHAHRDLVTLYKLGALINSIQDTTELSNILADQLMKLLQPDRVVIMLFKGKQGEPEKKVIASKKAKDAKSLDISMTMVHEALADGMAFLSYDALTDERFKNKKSVIINKIRSAMCTPLKGRNEIIGAIYVDTNITIGKFTEQDLQLLSIIGNQAGIAIQNARLYENIDDLFTGALKTLVATIEAKDSATSGHSARVTAFSMAIARELGIRKDMMRILNISALLHDIGKIAVPEKILIKPAPLNEDESVMMREHSARGAEIIKNIKNVDEVIAAIRHHHERYDGCGIPDGLKGEKIPLVSRIIAVADTFDAMTYDRPYRKSVSTSRAVKEIQRCSGTQFDPDVVNAFITAYGKGMLNEIPEKLI